MLQRSAAGGQPEHALLEENDRRLEVEQEPGDRSHDLETQARLSSQTKERKQPEGKRHGRRVANQTREVENHHRLAAPFFHGGFTELVRDASGKEGKDERKTETEEGSRPPRRSDQPEQGSDQEEDGEGNEMELESAKAHV